MNRILSIMLLVLVTYCVEGQSKLTRYQKKIKGETVIHTKDDSDRFVVVSMTANDRPVTLSSLEQQVTKNLFDLSEKGQQALIESIHEKTKDDLSAFLTNLPKDLSPKKKSKAYEVKRTGFVKKIEIDVKDILSGTANAGRISELYLSIRLPDNNDIKFIGFKNVVTRYEVVEFGTISMSRNRDFSVNAGFSTPDTGLPGGSVTGTIGRSITEEVGIGIRKIALKGSVNSLEATIFQQGYPSINLNDIITLEIIFEATYAISDLQLHIDSLFDENGKAVTDSSKISINHFYLTTPQSSPEILVNLGYEYIYRQINNKKGKNSPGEWDDKITYHRLLDKKLVEKPYKFLSENDLDPGVWVMAQKDSLDDNLYRFLYIDYYGELVQLKFTSLESAKEFEYWLKRTQSVTIKGFDLKIGSTPFNVADLKPGDIKNLNSRRI